MLLASVAPFIVAQYNVLAGYLGDNRQPWFLHGLPEAELPPERRGRIMHKFYERNAEGELVNVGWPNYVQGLLSESEQRTVVRVHDEHFSWPVRRPRLLETVQGLDADLLSLVECDHYDDFWSTEMQKLDYGGVYKRRPGRSKDGCAIFYRQSVFELEASQGIEFLPSCSSTISSSGADDTVPRFGDRVALLALLRHIESGRRIIFISTHLARNPEDPNKTKDRARQMAQLLYHLTRFATEHDAMQEQSSDQAVPAMIAGDMNETNLGHIATIARIKCGLAEEACHPFVFASRAPSTADTSVTAARQMCIDYLLLQSSHLAAEEAFEVDPATVSRDRPIPNERHPSDHLPIAFRIAFLDYADTVRDYAASWWDVIASAAQEGRQKDNTIATSFRKNPLRMDELRMAFGQFDKDGDGLCSVTEFQTGLAQLHGAHDGRGSQEERIAKTLNFLRELLPGLDGVLTLTDFTTVYIKSWLRSQSSVIEQVRSLQNILDLDLSDLLTSQRAQDEPMDADELLDCVIRNTFGDNFFRSQVRDAFSFFDFDASGSFDMMELYQSFSTACPFDVKAGLIQDIFDGMGKRYDEKIALDEFADYLVRNCLIKDPTWVSLKAQPSCAADNEPLRAQWL